MITDNCWLWTGTLNNSGYGSCGRTGAHRYSYELHKGPIPVGFLVMHSCDVRHCVNPEHLSVGTTTDNLRDMARKGRTVNQNTDKQICIRGHEYTDSNTYRLPGNRRICLCCKRDADKVRARTYRSRLKATAEEAA